MNRKSRSIIALAAAGAIGLGATAGLVGSAGAATAPKLRALALLDNGTTLAVLTLNAPSAERMLGSVSGLAGDSKLVGIDFRVQDGKFYGVGNSGGIYKVNSNTAVAAKVSQLSVALEGNDFAVDFNPAADRLRVVGDTGQNLRHDVNVPVAVEGPQTGTTADTPLAYVPGTPTAGITAVAYTNNDVEVPAGAKTGTLLYDLDTALDKLALQVPANAGTLVPLGPLGVSAASVAGFDIYSLRKNGLTINNTAYAVIRTGTSIPSLYGVELQSGTTTKFGSFDRPVADIAVQQR